MTETGIDDLLDDLEAARVALQTILTSIEDIADNLASNRDYERGGAVEELRELITRYRSIPDGLSPQPTPQGQD